MQLCTIEVEHNITIYIHFESMHCIRIVSLNVYFRLIFQVFVAHFWVDYLMKPLITVQWCLLSSAVTIDPQVFAIGCKTKRLTIQIALYRHKVNVDSEHSLHKQMHRTDFNTPTTNLGGNYMLARSSSYMFLYTLIKFRRYNKASLGELVPLEILDKHQQGLTRGIWPRHIGFLYQLVIPLCISFIPDHTVFGVRWTPHIQKCEFFCKSV